MKKLMLRYTRTSLTCIRIVAVQNYITAILVFLVVEMLMTWGFYGLCSEMPCPWRL